MLAYFATGGVSNGPTEAINGLIKKVKESDTATATSPTTVPAAPALRNRLADFTRHPDPRSATTLSCVEPDYEAVQRLVIDEDDWKSAKYNGYTLLIPIVDVGTLWRQISWGQPS